MLLGKRPRPPMKRTTSMSEITFDLNTTSTGAPHSQPSDPNDPYQPLALWDSDGGGGGGGGLDGLDQRPMMKLPSSSSASPRNHRSSADFGETAHFLKACGLCKRRLIPGRDIYMYRGDTAFCSLECRQQQMNLDERKDKCSSTAGHQVSAKGETMVAL